MTPPTELHATLQRCCVSAPRRSAAINRLTFVSNFPPFGTTYRPKPTRKLSRGSLKPSQAIDSVPHEAKQIGGAGAGDDRKKENSFDSKFPVENGFSALFRVNNRETYLFGCLICQRKQAKGRRFGPWGQPRQALIDDCCGGVRCSTVSEPFCNVDATRCRNSHLQLTVTTDDSDVMKVILRRKCLL
jgi:hypothetical protein